MPWDPTKSNQVTLPNGQVKVYPPGTPIEIAQADVRQSQGPSILPTAPTSGGQQTPREAEISSGIGRQADILGMGLEAATSFVPGVRPAATGFRVGAPMVIGAINDLLQGRNPLEGIAFNGVMGGGAEGLSRVIPKVTTPLALASGGAMNLPGGFRKTVDAFNTEATKSTFPVRVGREEPWKPLTVPDGMPILGGKELNPMEMVSPSSRGERLQTGRKLEESENMADVTGHQLPARNLAVANDNAPVRLPETKRENWDTFNSNTIREQTIAKTLKERFPFAPPAMLKRMWEEGLPEAFVGISPDDLKKPGVRRMALLDWQKDLLDRSSLGVREAGEVQRSESAMLKSLYDTRNQNVAISPADLQNKQLSEDLVKNLKNWRHGEADIQGNPQTTMQKFRERDPSPGQDGAITAADEKIGRLSLMDQANRKTRGQGAGARFGILATRGALGTGAGYAMGMDPFLSSLAAMYLLAPESISGAGFTASKASRYAPGAYRANETKKKVQRREP